MNFIPKDAPLNFVVFLRVFTQSSLLLLELLETKRYLVPNRADENAIVNQNFVFRERLEVEEMIKRIALEGISFCNCHKCTLCHCHLRKEQQLNSPETFDFSKLNTV